MRSKRILWGFIFVVVLVGGYLVYNQKYAPSDSRESATQDYEEPETIIWASGEVLPAEWAELSFPIGGRVDDILVAEGDGVVQGNLLIQLSMRELENAVEIAKTTREMTVAELDRDKAGPRPEEITSAEENVSIAEAALTGARASLRQTQAQHERLLAGSRDEEVNIASAFLKKAEAALQSAQAEYDKVKWYDAIGSSEQALTLQQATLDFEAAKAEYQQTLRGASSQDLAASQAIVDGAAAYVKGAEATQAQAEAELDLLRAGSRKEDIRVAEARVTQANAELDRAISNLNQATLHAPFDGTIGAIYVRTGEQAFAEEPAVAIGDLSHLRVETTDLRETDITRVDVGQPVEVTFDALPDVVLGGHVSHIAPKPSKEKGSVNYRTIIELDEFDHRLRWGMTAYVNITVG
jgi:multidrug efflux pump subunit AcrA (membrane-fusion protein)